MSLPTALPQIHIISLGAISKLLTFSLLSAHPTLPICLILRPNHPALQSHPLPLTLDNKSLSKSTSQNLTAASASDLRQGSIQHLILPTKSSAALPAAEELLRSGKFNADGATILSTQNGLGVLEGLCDLFPDAKFSILAGIMNHGVYSTSPFSAIHAGKADMLVGPARTQSGRNYLAELITSTPNLKATFEPLPQKVLLARLRKLAVNAVINPLTAIMDVPNGVLYSAEVYPHVQRVINLMIEEISAVTSEILRSQSSDQNAEDKWLEEALELLSVSNLSSHVRAVAHATAQNISSMRADILAGRLTEIDAINGAIVRGGQAHGIDTHVNGAIVKKIHNREHGLAKVNVQQLQKQILG